MVQVDVFWAYGFGASLAMAAGHKLNASKKPYETPHFWQTLVFLAVFWAPTGLLLLLRHPSWETMQAATNFYDISEWTVLLFGITNVTQGMLGFWVGQRLMKSGRLYAAQINWMAGYFGMFFILLYGWDGLGYDRFLFDSGQFYGEQGTLWTPGAATAAGIWPAIQNFLTSSVAMTLYTDGVWLVPPFVWLMYRFFKDSVEVHPQLTVKDNIKFWKFFFTYLEAVFLVGLSCAAIAALTVGFIGSQLGIGEVIMHDSGWYAPENVGRHVLSYVLGLPLAAAICWYALLRPGMPYSTVLNVFTFGLHKK